MDRSHVAALLDAHTPADAEEHGALSTIRRVLAETPPSVDLFDKRQTTPGHFTASAVVVSPDRQHVLLIHHPAFGLWIQPGGHTDPTDRSLPEAAARELREETGLTAPLLGLLDVAVHRVPDGIKGQPAHLHLDLRFAFTVSMEPPPSGDIPARWFPVNTLHQVQTDDSVRRAVRRLGGVSPA